MSSPQFFNRAGSQTLIADRKSRERERARERERETALCLHTNLLSWLVFLESRNTMFESTNQCASDEDPCADPESYVRGVQLCNSDNVFAFF